MSDNQKIQDTHRQRCAYVYKRVRLLPQDQWAVLIPHHHPGFIDWATFEMNQARLAKNAPPPPRTANGAVREGSALLQGLATCGRCGRHLRVYYQGKNSTPGYYCEQQDQAALQQFRLQVERARYEAERAERRYRAVEPENRLVARTLETEWEHKLNDQRGAEAQLARKAQEHQLQLTDAQREQVTPGAPWRIRMTQELKKLDRTGSAARLRHHARSDAPSGSLPPNHHATCKARRALRRACQLRQAQRPAHACR